MNLRIDSRQIRSLISSCRMRWELIFRMGCEFRGVRHQLTMPSRCGTAGKGKQHACLGLPDAFALEQKQGNHTPSPGAKLLQEDRLCGSGSVVS